MASRLEEVEACLDKGWEPGSTPMNTSRLRMDWMENGWAGVAEVCVLRLARVTGEGTTSADISVTPTVLAEFVIISHALPELVGSVQLSSVSSKDSTSTTDSSSDEMLSTSMHSSITRGRDEEVVGALVKSIAGVGTPICELQGTTTVFATFMLLPIVPSASILMQGVSWSLSSDDVEITTGSLELGN